MKLSVIIPVKNDAENLDACLHSIRNASAQDLFEYEILVIDNGSTDDSVTVAKDHAAKIFLAPSATVAKLRNMGANECTGDILAFIDSDCTVSADWFVSIEPYLDDEQVLCFGAPPIIPSPANWVQSCWYQIRRKDTGTEVAFDIDWLESMNMFVRRQIFQQIDGFDETMETCEDYDLCKRISSHGRLICDNRIIVTHHGEAKTIRHFFQKERWRGSSNLDGLRKHRFEPSEIPSVLLPFIQVVVFTLAILAIPIVFFGYLPGYIWFAAIIAWQLPLALLSIKKSKRPFCVREISGIWILLNIYFLARGISLFFSASWTGQKKPID